MSIRVRLLLSFTATIFITIFLFATAAFLIAVAVTGDVKHVREFYTSRYAVMPLSQQEENVSLEAKYLGKHDPQQLLDQKQLKEFEQKLTPVQAGILVRVDKSIFYASPILQVPSMDASLPPFEAGNIKVRDTLLVDDRFYTYVKFDFNFADKREGSVYVMKEVSPYAELTRNLLPLLIGILLLVVVLTNGLLNYFVSRSIIKPLYRLKAATEQIKAGQLNFRVEATGHDEIGQVCHAFEEMREKLKESVEVQLQYEENRKELISNISHDLKTPITSIIGYVEGIRDGVADTPERLEKYLATIHHKAKAMDHLIDELFLFSKLDLGKLPFVYEQIDINRFLDDYIGELRFDLQEKGIGIEWKPISPDRPLMVLADRDKLKRVLSNIVENCVKFMDKQTKTIRFAITEQQQQIRIAIEDNGAGIHPEALPHIFDRFYRAEHSRSTATGGSGLGLAIAKQIILEHGAAIWAESEHGTGTRICFTLRRTGEGN